MTSTEPAPGTVGEVSLRALPPDGTVPADHPLHPDPDGVCRVRLACLPGADAVHLEVRVAGQTRLRAEVRAQAGESVHCTIRLDAAGEPLLDAGNRQVFLLALGSRYHPLPPLPPPVPGCGWDLCVLVDATTRDREDATAGPGGTVAGRARETLTPTGRPGPGAFLLERPARWQRIVGAVADLVRRLSPGETANLRSAIIAFADEPPPPGIHAPDLIPTFHLRHLPEDRPPHALSPMTAEALSAALTGLAPSPGGDFVDALADGLAAATALQWGEDRRRVLILIGDSPGHSAADPAPWGGDARARVNDTDAEIARLHREHRVEVLTLYHPPPPGLDATLGEAQRALLRHARAQYRRLAATPALAFTTADFDPARAAAELNGRREPLGRGPCWGRLVPDDPAAHGTSAGRR